MLTELKIKSNKLSDGRYGDERNLYLLVRNGGTSRNWIFRYKSPLTGKTRDMGLGKYPEVSLSKARSEAFNARQVLANKLDPLEERKRAEILRQRQIGKTFEEASMLCIEQRRSRWKDSPRARTEQKMRNALARYAFPVIGNRPCSTILREDIQRIMTPLLDAGKTNMFEKTLQYIRVVLDFAKANNWREGDNPAQWKGNLDQIMKDPKDLAPKKHHKALNLEETKKLMQALPRYKTSSYRAVYLTILTATRSAEARAARWEEINFDNALWTIPAERMKTEREHIVVLAPQAISFLKSLMTENKTPKGLIFSNLRGKELTAEALLKSVKRVARDIGVSCPTVHGFRATFSTWAHNETTYDSDTIEHALSHVAGSQVKRAYQRSTMEEKRRPLMNDWAEVCTGNSET